MILTLCGLSLAAVATCHGGATVEFGPVNASQLVVATEQAKRRLVLLDGETNGVAKVVWEWSAPNDPRIATNHHDRSWSPDECKPIDGGRTILTTASAGLFAAIDVATCRAKFYGLAGGNPHSIERLPDGRYVVASSEGNALTVFDVGDHPFDPDRQPKTKYALEFAHGAVWDAKRNCLWAIGAYVIEKLDYDPKTMSLKRLAVYDFKSAGYHVGHDLILRNGTLEFTVHEGLVAFDPETAAFAPLDVSTRNVKSVSYADGWRLTSVPQVKWWTDTLTCRRGADVRMLRLPKAKFYKARFLVDLKPSEPWPSVKTEQLKDELVQYAHFHGHADFAAKISSEPNTTDWIGETLAYGMDLLKSREGRDFRDSERRTALEIIDYPLHVDNYDPRHTTAAETNAWEKAIAAHLSAARERVLREAHEAKVPKDALRIWRIYNMAYLVKGPRHTVLIDLSKRPYIGGLWTEKDFAAFADLADVFVLTHPHRDHCCPEILQAFLARKKPIVLPCDLKLNDSNAHVLDTDHFEPLEIGGIRIRNFLGNQGKGVPCNVYWMEIDGVRLADNGDNYIKEQERRLADCPPVDVIIASTWNTVTNMVASCAAAKGFNPQRAVFLPSHENELGHSVAHREGYRRMYANPDRLAAPGFSWPRTVPLHWGESVLVGH